MKRHIQHRGHIADRDLLRVKDLRSRRCHAATRHVAEVTCFERYVGCHSAPTARATDIRRATIRRRRELACDECEEGRRCRGPSFWLGCWGEDVAGDPAVVPQDSGHSGKAQGHLKSRRGQDEIKVGHNYFSVPPGREGQKTPGSGAHELSPRHPAEPSGLHQLRPHVRSPGAPHGERVTK